MPILNISDLKEGMIVASPVKIQGTIMVESGKPLTSKVIHVLKAWGVAGIDVKGDGVQAAPAEDMGLSIPLEDVAKVKALVDPCFKTPPADEIMFEVKRIMMKHAVVDLAKAKQALR